MSVVALVSGFGTVIGGADTTVVCAGSHVDKCLKQLLGQRLNPTYTLSVKLPQVSASSRFSKGRCDEMYAFFLSVMVNKFFQLLSLKLQTNTSVCSCRGCRQKHNSHFFNQGVFRCPCASEPSSSYAPPQTPHSQVQHVVPEVTIPPEVTPENVTTYIVDSGGLPVTPTRVLKVQLTHRREAGPQDRLHLESEIRKAHVICVVYSIDNPNSFDRIPAYWLPHFRQLGVNVTYFDYERGAFAEQYT